MPFHSNADEICEVDFCNNMKEYDTGLRCVKPTCRKTDAEILVNGAGRFLFFEVKSACCDEFKKRLVDIFALLY